MVFIAIIPALLLAGLFTIFLKRQNPKLGFSRFALIWSFLMFFGFFGMAVLRFLSPNNAQILNCSDWILITIPFFIFFAILFFYGLGMAHTALTDDDGLTRKPIRNFLITIVVAWLVAMPNVYVLNMAFDTGTGEQLESVIKEKADTMCTTVTIEDPGMDKNFWTLRVDRDLYDWARPGVSILKYEYKQGRFGIPFVQSLSKSEDAPEPSVE